MVAKFTTQPTNKEVVTKINDVINDMGTVKKVNNTSPDSNGNVSLTIPTVNNATLTIQKNGTTVKTFTANASSNVTCNITVPTKTSDLTNDSSFITGITSSMVTTALGYTPYNSTNPSGYQANVIETIKVNNVAQTVTSKAVNITVPTAVTESTVSGWGFTKNVGTVTSVNNTQPDANGNVTLTVTGGADTDLSNLSATGKKVLYSGYVHSVKDLEATAVNYPTSTDKSYDLTQYLPNDTSNYFVLMRFDCTTGTTSGNQVGMQVHSDLESYTINLARTRTRTNSNVNCACSGFIPIGTGRTLYINHNSNFTGTFTATLLGYIRIGTNT